MFRRPSSRHDWVSRRACAMGLLAVGVIATVLLASSWRGASAAANGLPDPYASTRDVAVVTGGTGSICREVTAGIAREGWDVVVACRPGDELHCRDVVSTAWRDVPAGPRYYVEDVDLGSVGSTIAFVSRVTERYGRRVRGLVNCASVRPQSLSLSSDGLELQLHVNVLAYRTLVAGLAPLLALHAHGASVVHVASRAAYAMLPAIDLTELLATPPPTSTTRRAATG